MVDDDGRCLTLCLPQSSGVHVEQQVMVGVGIPDRYFFVVLLLLNIQAVWISYEEPIY